MDLCAKNGIFLSVWHIAGRLNVLVGQLSRPAATEWSFQTSGGLRGNLPPVATAECQLFCAHLCVTQRRSIDLVRRDVSLYVSSDAPLQPTLVQNLVRVCACDLSGSVPADSVVVSELHFQLAKPANPGSTAQGARGAAHIPTSHMALVEQHLRVQGFSKMLPHELQSLNGT